MKNIKKAIRQLIEFDRSLSILCIGMIFISLVGIIMIILPIPAEVAIPVIVVLGMLLVAMIAANMGLEIEKKHRKKVQLKCVYSSKKKKVNISQGSIQYRGMSIPCEYKLDISEQLLNILEPCDGYWDNAPEDMQEKGLQCLHAFFQLYSQSNVSSKNTVTYADCWNKKMFDMRLKLVSNALSKKNWCAAGHELIDLVALDDLSDIYAYNALVDLYKKHIQRERI